MQKIILIIVSVISLLLPMMVPAQGPLYVSNLGQTPTGSAAFGSDAWLAQGFGTGTNADGYVLNSVQLLMDAASGSASGFTVSLYNQGSAGPGTNLGNLSGPDPSAGGLFTYATSGITLSPSALYFVVVTAATPVAQGAFEWSKTQPIAGTSADGWFFQPGYFSSTDGLSWQLSRLQTFQMAIYATAVPEPITLALAGVGLATLSFRRRK